MKPSALSKIINTVAPGTKLRLTFKRSMKTNQQKSSIDDGTVAILTQFLVMTRQRILITNEIDKAVLVAVIQSRHWSSSQDRTFVVEASNKFDPKLFEQSLGNGLEKIEIIPRLKRSKLATPA